MSETEQKESEPDQKDKNDLLLHTIGYGNVHRVNMVLNTRADIEARDRNDDTPLILATTKMYPDIVKLLLERGANPNAKNKMGDTALIEAVQNAFILEFYNDYKNDNKRDIEECVKLLVTNKKTNIHEKNHKGRSALDYALMAPPEIAKEIHWDTRKHIVSLNESLENKKLKLEKEGKTIDNPAEDYLSNRFTTMDIATYLSGGKNKKRKSRKRKSKNKKSRKNKGKK